MMVFVARRANKSRESRSLSWKSVLKHFYLFTHELFRAVYMRQNANDTTGEHSTVFLKSIHGSGTYLRGFQDDFRNGSIFNR